MCLIVLVVCLSLRPGPSHSYGMNGSNPWAQAEKQQKGRREAPIFRKLSFRLKGTVWPIRPWALTNLVMALPTRLRLTVMIFLKTVKRLIKNLPLHSKQFQVEPFFRNLK